MVTPTVPYRRLTYRRPIYRLLLEHPMHANLRLLWIAEPSTQGAIKIEEQTARGRITEVLRAKHVEHLRDKFEPFVLPDVERPRQSHIPGEVAVVLADRIAPQNMKCGVW